MRVKKGGQCCLCRGAGVGYIGNDLYTCWNCQGSGEGHDWMRSDIEMSGNPLVECEYIEIDWFLRVYFIPNGKKLGGFEFAVYEVDGGNIECWINGNAHWDGLKHIYFGDIETTCTCPITIAKVFVELRNLEERFCDLEEIGERREL